jgi:hypothetical protein
MAPHAAVSDDGEYVLLDSGWAASFKDGRWQSGIQFFHEQIAEFSPVKDQDEVERLLQQAREQLSKDVSALS